MTRIWKPEMNENSIIIVLTALVLLVVGFLVVGLHSTSENESILQLQDYQDLHARHLANRIQSFLWGLRLSIEALTTSHPLSGDAMKELENHIQDYSRKMGNHYIKRISLHDKAGKTIHSTDAGGTVLNDSERDLFIRANDPANKGKIFVYPLLQGLSKGRLEPGASEHPSSWILFAAPLYYGRNGSKKQETFSGVLSIVFDLKEFLADELLDPKVTPGRVWIMGTDGGLLFHSQHPEMVLRNIFRRDKNCDQCHASFDYVQKILKKRQGTADYRIKDTKKLAAFAPMKFEGASWIVVVDSEYNRVASIIKKSLRDHLVLLGVVILAVVSSSVFLGRNIRSKERAKEETKHWRQVVAERKEAQEILQKSEERYRTLVETMTDGLAVQDNNGILSYVNGKFCEMLGYSRDELVGQPADSFIHVSNHSVFDDKKWEHEPYEITLKKKDGSNVYALMSPKSITDSNGQLAAHFAVVTDITMRKRIWQQLKFLSFKILTAQETERRRISRELHDEIGGTVSGLRFKFSFVEKKLREDQFELRTECEECLRYLDRIIEDIRRLCRDLSPSILENLGFAAALRWLVDNFAKIYNVKVTVGTVEIEHLFSRDVQLMIYRVFQEALGNIGKHAQAANVTIGIKEQGETVSFVIEDDGKGFDVKQAFVRDAADGGLGLAIMQERVQMLQGTFDLWSEEGRGTRITFSIPIKGRPSLYGDLSHPDS